MRTEEVLVAPEVRGDNVRPELPPLSRLTVLIAVCFGGLELAVSARYGFHRDELYFLACARHLAWGYVDQPPFVPFVAWLATHLFGTSPTALRVLPSLAGTAAVITTALMARELGGGRKAQVLAALAASTSPQVVAAVHLLSTTTFDLFFWSLSCYLLLRLLRTGDQRLWFVLGAVAGLGLENKINLLFLLVALAAGLLVGGQRRVFTTWQPWAAGLLALAIWAPNLMWNAHHNWAAISMLRSLHQENSGLGASVGFIPSQLIVVGPVLVVFWIAGLRTLLRSPLAKPLGIAYLLLVGLFALSGAKPYYLAGMYFSLFAAGGAWAEHRLDSKQPPRGLRGWVVLMVVGFLASASLVLPVLPENTLAKGSWEGQVNKDLSATVGWHSFVGQIGRISRNLPPDQRSRLVLFTGDYGAAGAIDLWGSEFGLPHAISGHNSYWWWGPDGASDHSTTIAVNLSRGYLQTVFANVVPAGTVVTPNGVWSEERGDPIWICTGQKAPWARIWLQARHYG